MNHDKVNRSLQTFTMLPAKSCNVLNPNISMKNMHICCIYIPEFHDTRSTKEIFHSENIILSRFHVSTKNVIYFQNIRPRWRPRTARPRSEKSDRDRGRDRDTTSVFFKKPHQTFLVFFMKVRGVPKKTFRQRNSFYQYSEALCTQVSESHFQKVPLKFFPTL